jgi:hypothetical protein
MDYDFVDETPRAQWFRSEMGRLDRAAREYREARDRRIRAALGAAGIDVEEFVYWLARELRGIVEETEAANEACSRGIDL